VNTDGAGRGSPGIAVSAGLFRDDQGNFLGGFALHLGVLFSFSAELMVVVKAIDIARHRHWNSIWLESDSMLVIAALKNSSLVPW